MHMMSIKNDASGEVRSIGGLFLHRLRKLTPKKEHDFVFKGKFTVSID